MDGSGDCTKDGASRSAQNSLQGDSCRSVMVSRPADVFANFHAIGAEYDSSTKPFL